MEGAVSTVWIARFAVAIADGDQLGVVILPIIKLGNAGFLAQ